MANDLSRMEPTRKAIQCGKRHLIAFLLFVAYAITFTQNVNLSIAIVPMVDNSDNEAFPEFDWTEEQRGWILSSFFWGFILLPFPSGVFCQKYGGNILLLTIMLFGSILTIITVPLVAYGWMYLCGCRFLIGLSQGCIYPCFYTLLSKWTHKIERTFLTSLIYTGSKFGVVATMATGGVLSTSPMGWPSIFYFTGAAGIIWSIFWWIYGAESPSNCRRITDDELNYIQAGMVTEAEFKVPIPWRRIIGSIPFWSLFITAFCSSFIFFTMLTEVPTYISEVLHFNITSNALLSALPYLLMFIFSLFLSNVFKYLIWNKYCSVGVARKLSNSLGTWLPSILLIVLGYTDSVVAGITLLVLLNVFNCGVITGILINHMDLAPQFSGTLVGITTTVQNIGSILGPLLVGYIVHDLQNNDQWRIVFYLIAAITSIGNLIFVLFGSGELQDWNTTANKRKEKN